MDQVVEKYGLQKTTLLREISIKTGIQVTHVVESPFPHSMLIEPNGLYGLTSAFIRPVDPDKRVQL